MKRKDLWGGRFRSGPAEQFRALNDSFSYDVALLDDDVEASTAWAEALGQVDVLSAEEVETIVAGLTEIAKDSVMRAPDGAWEDVHSFLEGRLYEKIGQLAGKLHTGRSRNDQVATAFRLWLRRAMIGTREACVDLADALVKRAEDEASTAMPGYTHLKQAEPVTFGHWCLAYAEMLLRDADRLDAACARSDECPLGSAALSGTPLPIDRDALAKRLGFARASSNSLDAVSDRDMAADFLFAASMLLVHLSRFAEDVIVYSSDEFGFIELPDELATGSSRMPHKKNPDLLELTRGHAGRAIGELTGLLAVIKGLPMSYNKDLQLDKEPVFRVREVLSLLLPLLAQLVAELRLHRDRMRTAASSDLLLATELADCMAARGVPFREAHEIVGARVVLAAESGKRLAELPLDAPMTDEDLAALDVDRALARRSVIGGTAPAAVLQSATRLWGRISRFRSRS